MAAVSFLLGAGSPVGGLAFAPVWPPGLFVGKSLLLGRLFAPAVTPVGLVALFVFVCLGFDRAPVGASALFGSSLISTTFPALDST